jgi:hypothetical protein
MKVQPHDLRILNLGLLLLCLAVGIATRMIGSAKAQSLCEHPPLTSTPIRDSWTPDTQVTVLIDDDWSTADAAAFEAGIRKWNDWGTFDCSGVSFDSYGSQHFTNYSAIPPVSTIYWMKHEWGSTYNGNTTLIYGGLPLRVIGARVEIDPGAINNAPSNTSGPFSYFNYLGTHEVGHMFGLKDCIGCANGSSIMGGTLQRRGFQRGRANAV